MSKYAFVPEWTEPLRNLALGVSIASFFLVPSSPPTVMNNQRFLQQKVTIVETLPDGIPDLRRVHFRTAHGLDTPTILLRKQQPDDKIENQNLPYILRNITGLPVETLASLAGVSRNAYYKWLDGGGVNEEHVAHLKELLDVFRTLQNIRGSSLKEFLETSGIGGKPVDMLVKGESNLVIGLALRASASRSPVFSLSNVARNSSGLPGWTRPAISLNWGAPRLTDKEQEVALDQLSPRAVPENFHPISGILDDETKERFARWIGHRFNRPAIHDDIVAAVHKPIVDNLAELRRNNDLDIKALDMVKEVRLAKIVGNPPYDVRLLFIIPESGLPDDGFALARLVSRMSEWFNPLAARLVAWDVRHLYEISVGDYLDTQQIYLEHYTYQGESATGFTPPSHL